MGSSHSYASRPNTAAPRATGSTSSTVLRSALGAGKPLAAPEQSRYAASFGQDFSQVRVHTDGPAQAFAQSMGAKAVTQGDDIAFGPGRYQPGSSAGNTLLAHELAHVAQQRQGGGAPASAEQRARNAAPTAAAGGRVEPGALGGADAGLYRDPVDDGGTKDDKEKPWTPGGPMPKFQLNTPGPLDWMKLREPFSSRGLQMSLRDADSINEEAQRIARQLAVFGIGPNFKLDYKLGTLTRDDIINLGLGTQLDDRLGREHPNFMDRSNRDWKLANPGFQTPFISKSWKF